jgi:2-oxoglutarate dehydrogenase E2 component (dihydrolipoamide succinyltransferase)
MQNLIVELKVPVVGESITEVGIGEWLKSEGDPVRQDESLVVLETDKATLEVPSPVTGRLVKVLKNKGERVQIGEVIGHIAPDELTKAKEMPSAPPAALSLAQAPGVKPATARDAVGRGASPDKSQSPGPADQVQKEVPQPASEPEHAAEPVMPPPRAVEDERLEEVVPMSVLRRKIAERLVAAQRNAALLTTFNEIDMGALIALRQQHQEQFQARYQVKLGFMSFFVKAVIEALKETPPLNAEIREANIVYRNYFDIGIAIGGGRGLVVPVLRRAERLSFAEIELAIASFAQKVQENKIRPEDLQGGTFTITNGGVYGSLLSTPLLNPPQSGTLGMHAIQERPIALNGKVVIRPMMYVALTYDHRLVDGREAVTFLRRLKELIENPVRMLTEI